MKFKLFVVALVGLSCLSALQRTSGAESAAPATATTTEAWRIGTPIVTYWAGPAMSEVVATQMAAGGFNVVWCGENDLDLLQRHHLRGMVHSELLTPATVEAPEQLQKLDALIERIRNQPAFYAYFITDEPGAGQFPGLGKLVAHLKERDPARLAYMNLFPTYATNKQLGTKGETTPAYVEYVHQFLDTVKPALVSWDHYQFYKTHDGEQYFLNLKLIREASLQSGVPFLNIIQAAAWEPTVRVPTADETRYLIYTSVAYGAQGISYYVYSASGHEGGIARADGTPTPIYETLTTLNPEFVALASELQPLRSLGVYHTSMKEAGCVAPPAHAVFRIAPEAKESSPRGLLLGTFGPAGALHPTAVIVVNLDYKAEMKTILIGPANLEIFDAITRRWSAVGGDHATLTLPPGGGKLLRVSK